MVRIGDIAHVENQRGFLHLFKSGAKSSQQSFGQIADESHGIGDQDAAVRRKAQRANGGIEGGEHPGGNQDFGAAQRIEQCGFACVGIPDKRDGSEGNGIARFAPERPLFADFIDAGLNFAHAVANPPPVGFQFLFTRTTHADSSCSATRSTGTTTTTFAAQARHRRTLTG